MTIQLDRPTFRSSNDMSATAVTGDPEPVFVGGWSAALGYYNQQPAARVTPETNDSDDIEGDTEVNIFARQIGLRNKITAHRARRRLNRTYRRNQREFDAVLNNVAHDPASQRELQASWTLGH